MQFLYTLREKFDKTSSGWEEFIRWSNLTHLTEIVSVDTALNEVLVQPIRTIEYDWEYIYSDKYYETGFFTTIDYVFKRSVVKKRFNFLSVAINPETNCRFINLKDFDFIGYDLLDQCYNTSALTNCGGFDETFSAEDLNSKGLIEEFDKAYFIQKKLLINNPNEEHANTNVIAIWRNKIIGQ